MEESTVLTSSIFQIAHMDRILKVRLFNVLDLVFKQKCTFETLTNWCAEEDYLDSEETQHQIT